MTMTKSLEQVSRGQKWTKTDSKTRRVSHILAPTDFSRESRKAVHFTLIESSL